VESWLGQYCLNVADLERSVTWWSALGLVNTSRTEIPDAFEAIMANPETGGQFQIAQQKSQKGSVRLGNALWKLYVNTPDISGTFAAAVAAGGRVVSEPERRDRWPVTVAFVRDPDGRLVELVQRHPWQAELPADRPWLGQYCINVTDLNVTVDFYEKLGLTCTSRTEIEHASEAILEQAGRGGKMQLAQQKNNETIDHAEDVWKLYLNTDNCEELYHQAIACGGKPVRDPVQLERWPTIIAFFSDLDGYLIEIVQKLN
jgi:lactoylglutathione lyase